MKQKKNFVCQKFSPKNYTQQSMPLFMVYLFIKKRILNFSINIDITYFDIKEYQKKVQLLNFVVFLMSNDNLLNLPKKLLNKSN